MRDVYFIDTSVLLNILSVPNRNQCESQIKNELSEYVRRNVVLILPLATIIETGNHIAHIDNGSQRRNVAKRMSELLIKTADDEAPWVYDSDELSRKSLRSIAVRFPDAAMSGTGVGDLSILEAYEKYKQMNGKYVHVHIWTLDKHLQAYS